MGRVCSEGHLRVELLGEAAPLAPSPASHPLSLAAPHPSVQESLAAVRTELDAAQGAAQAAAAEAAAARQERDSAAQALAAAQVRRGLGEGAGFT